VKPSVLILEVQSKASLPIIESAWRQGRQVIAGAPARCCAGMFSRYPHERVLYPSPLKAPAAFESWLVRFVRERRPDMLYPTGDPVTAACAALQDELRRWTRLVLPPAEVFAIGRSKVGTLRAAAAAGVAIPDTWFADDGDLARLAAQARYPCLIKPAVSAGARGITRVETAAQLVQQFPTVAAQYGECFVQDYVPQTGMQYKADLILAHGSDLLAGVVYEKLRYYPPNGGSSVLNRTVARPDILAAATAVVRQIGWHGFCDFDFITDPRDGRVKLMEINPRFPESFRATYAAGLDMVEMLWELAHGRTPVAVKEYRVGQFLRFLPGDVMWLLTSRERRPHLRSWLSFWGRDRRDQVCSWRDPGAIVGYLAENFLVLFDRKKRAERFRMAQARRG
jgi:predicted ATP-grasp superfamily ATP-dependent carboligase